MLLRLGGHGPYAPPPGYTSATFQLKKFQQNHPFLILCSFTIYKISSSNNFFDFPTSTVFSNIKFFVLLFGHGKFSPALNF